jgi:hypothetical protein
MTPLLQLVLFLAVSMTDITVVTLPTRGDISINLSPAGTLELQRAGTVSRVRVEIKRIQPAGSHGSGLNTYVVWAVSPEGIFENLGSLEITNGDTRFEATTRFEQFGILITAEPHYMVDQPSSAAVYRNLNPRSADVRRMTVSATIGTYDYAGLEPATQGTLPGVVVQARTAFQIATNAEAERYAESEYRRARVALDTVEEMLTRRVPADIVAASANEAIRRSQQAVVRARDRTLQVALETARNEAALLDGEKAQLQGQLQQLSQQLTEQQAAAEAQARRFQTELADANRETQRVAFEGTQTAERLRNAERELAELQRKQEELQRGLSFQLLPEAFDARKALTAKGRDALTRISGIASFMPTGQIRITGAFDDAKEKRVMDFLVAAGVAADRISLIRE